LSLEKPGSVEVFSDVLRRLLGSSSVIIEKLILKAFFSKFGLDFAEKEDYRFLDYIKELKEECKREEQEEDVCSHRTKCHLGKGQVWNGVFHEKRAGFKP